MICGRLCCNYISVSKQLAWSDAHLNADASLAANGTNATANATALALPAGGGANASSGGANASGAGEDMVIEVSAVEVSAGQVVIRAPAVSLSEGEIITNRAYPCWNPPCRRTLVTLAINGVDFVGRPEPMEFFFFYDPWRFLGLMETELVKVIAVLGLIVFTNALLTWRFRHFVYERYLHLKYRLKNRVIHPIVFRHYTWGQMA